jgi:hypothetical protein
MEAVIFSKVLDYLVDHVGDMVSPGQPRWDAGLCRWQVPILCRTPKGVLPVGEFLLDERGDSISVPDPAGMIRVLNGQLERLPYLVYGDRSELERKGVEVVSV